MLPLIRSGSYVFVEKIPPEEFRPGDAVLYESGGQRFIHRIWKIASDTATGTNPGGYFFVVGDDGGVTEPHRVEMSQVVGRLHTRCNGFPGLLWGRTWNAAHRAGRAFKNILRASVPALIVLLLASPVLSAATRLKTVEFNYSMGPSTGVLTAVKHTFPYISFRLPDAVTVRKAWLELDGMSQTNADIADTVIYFNQGTAANTPREVFSGLVLMYNTGESIPFHFTCDIPASVFVNVTALNNYATAVQFTAATGRFSRLAMKLYVTYEYDDTANTQVNTVRFPLKYSATVASLQGAMNANSAVTFNYNAEIAEAANPNFLVRQQWFEVRGHRLSAGAAMSSSIVAKITGYSYAPTITLDGSLADSYDFLYLTTTGTYQSIGTGIFGYVQDGFDVNTGQSLSVENTQTIFYNVGGECVVTYEYSGSAAVKTKTVNYLLGADLTGAGTTFPVRNLYFEESDINFKALYAQIGGTYNGTASAGGSGNVTWNYSLNGRAGTAQAYTLLTQAAQIGEFYYFLDLWSTTPNTTWYNGCPLIVSDAVSNAAYTGSQQAELYATYQYTDASKFTDSSKVFAFTMYNGVAVSTSLPFTTYTPTVEALEGRKVRTSGYLTGTFLDQRNGNTITANPSLTLNINSSAQSSVNQPNTGTESIIFPGIYTDPLQLLTTNNATLTANTTLTTTNGNIFGNALAVITYSYFPPPDTPASPDQYLSDGVTPIPAGNWINGSSVILRMDLSSRISGVLSPVVEVNRIGTNFNGAVVTTGTGVNYSTTTASVTGAITLAGLTDGATYHWQARAAGINGTSLWTSFGGNPETSVDFGVDLSSPTVNLTAPLNGSTTNQVSLKFTWSGTDLPAASNSGIGDYTLQASTDPGFGNICYSSITANASVTTVLPQATYYWKVSAADKAGNAGSWVTYSVQVDSTPPSLPNLSGPLDQSATNQLSLAFNWSSSDDSGARGSSGVSGCEVYVSTDPNFLVFASSAFAVSPPCSLPVQQQFYYWRVRAKDNAANFTAWTSTWAVRVDTTVPTAPGLLLPVTDTATANGTVTFSWGAVSDAATGNSGIKEYELWLSSYSNFSTLTYSTRTPSVSYAYTLTQEATYYWQVRAVDNAGNVSAWSASRHLQYDATPPVPARANSPDSQQSPPVYRAADPGNYIDINFDDTLSRLNELKYRVTSQPDGGGTVFINWTLLVSSPANVASFTNNWGALPWTSLQEWATNYVHVYYSDRAGNYGIWNNAFDILKDTTPPAAPSLQLPADNYPTYSSAVNFDWSDAVDLKSGASYYLLQAATSTTFFPVTYSSQTNVSQGAISGIAQNTYFWRTLAWDRAANISVYSATRTFTVDLSTPTNIIGGNLLGGDTTWRSINNATYDVSFNDTGGSKLSRFEVSVSTGSNRALPILSNWTDSAVNISGASSYNTPWKLPDIIWQDMLPSTTHYISLRTFDLAGNCSTYIDAFFVRKGTSNVSISIGNTLTGGDTIWHSAYTDQAYDVDFLSAIGDDLKQVQYTAYANKNLVGMIPNFDWKDIPGIALPAGTTSYTADWNIGATDFTSLPDGATSYISVRCWDEVGTTITIRDAFFVRKDTTPPDVPVLAAPLNGSATGQLNVMLSWSPAADLASGTSLYYVQAATSTDFGAIAFSANTSTASIATSDLVQATYYWQVMAKDRANNWSNFSPYFAVQIDTTAPPQTTLSSPADGFTTNYMLRTFTWNPVADPGPAGMSGYLLKVSTRTDFTTIYYSSETAAVSVTTSLSLSATFYWRVQPVDRARNIGPDSAYRAVVLDTVAPPVPQLTQPADGFPFASQSIAFNVTGNDDGPAGVKDYQLQVATSTTFFPVTYSTDTVLLPLTTTFAENKYWWRARTRDNAGNYSVFAATRSFFVDLSSPPVTALSSPADDTRTSANPVSFSWGPAVDPGTSASGTDLYELVLSTDSGFGVINHSSSTRNTFASITFAAENIYYAKVRSRDLAGNLAPYSTARSVTYDTTPPQVTDNQTDDSGWSPDASASYDVDFFDTPDTGGAGLRSAQYRIFAASTPAGAPAGAELVAPQDIFTPKTIPERTTYYTLPWQVSGPAFGSLNQGCNYVFVRSSDIAGNFYETPSYVFYVKKDTAPPSVDATGEPAPSWVNTDGTHAVFFADDGIGVAVASYSVCAQPNRGGTPSVGWTTIFDSSPPVGATSDPWIIDFTLLTPGTNYVSVRTADALGNVRYATDTFRVWKDTIAPAAVANLSVSTGTTGGSLLLKWTAPADDAMTDPIDRRLTGYLVKYKTTAFTSVSDFLVNGATYYNSWQPAAPTVAEQNSLTSGLVEGTTYYVGIAGIDKAGNTASLVSGSTNYSCTTRIPPASITDLAASAPDTLDPGSVELTWRAVGNDAYTGTASGYIVKYGSWPFTAGEWNSPNLSTSTVSLSWTPQPAGEIEDQVISGLAPGTTYFFAITAYDAAAPGANYSVMSNTTSIKSVPTGPADGLLAYAEQTLANPRYWKTTSAGASWLGAYNANNTAANVYWTVLRSCPVVRNQKLLATLSSTGAIYVQSYNGQNDSWTPAPAELQTTITATDSAYRPLDIAYEQNTGRAIVAWRGAAAGQVSYRIWVSTQDGWLGPATTLSIGGSGAARWIRLEPRPGTNEIMLVEEDANNDIYVARWTGSAWSAGTLMTAAAYTATYQCFDVTWENSRGNCMVLWGEGTLTKYSLWASTASLWQQVGATGPNVTAAAGVNWLKLAADRQTGSNRIAMATLDSGSDWNVCIWDGAAWAATPTELSTTMALATPRCIDIAWEKDTGKCLAVGALTSPNNVYASYATWTGSWSGVTTYSSYNLGNGSAIKWLQLTPDPNSNKMVLLAANSGTTNAVNVRPLNWTGTGWNSVQNNLISNGPNGTYELFMLSLNQYDTVSPSFANNQDGDTVWRSTGTAFYNVSFYDTGGSHLSRVQAQLASSAGSADVYRTWQDELTGLNSDNYTSTWTLTSTSWNQLARGQTYVSLQVFDGVGNNGVLPDAFYVLKDTEPPQITSVSTVSNSWYTTPVDPGNVASATFSEQAGLSLLTTAQYLVYPQPDRGGTIICQSAIFNYSPANASQSTSFGLKSGHWDLLANSSNYVTLQCFDVAGNTKTVTDAFVILKDTIPPATIPTLSAAPGPFRGTITLSWLAPGDDGTQKRNIDGQYLVKYASYAVTEPLFAGANTFAQTMTPQTTDALESITIQGLDPFTTYYFAVKTKDKAALWSDISNSTNTLPRVDNVYINEIYATGSGSTDWVELYNSMSSPQPLNGWTLVYDQGTIDSPGTEATVWTGGATSLASHDYCLIPSLNLNGGASHHVKLKDDQGRVVDIVQWPVTSAGRSFARISDGNADYFEVDLTPTQGYANSNSTWTIKINEIDYASTPQSIELYNSGTSTPTLANWTLRNTNNIIFTFTRKIFASAFSGLDASSVDSSARSWTDCFGGSGLSSDTDQLVLENDAGQVVDRVTWKTGSNTSYYTYKAAAASYKAASLGGISAPQVLGRQTDGLDTNNNTSDLGPLAASFGTRNSGTSATANAFTYPALNSYLPRRFKLDLKLGAVSTAGSARNALWFVRTGGNPDPKSPHIYRLSDLGFILANTSPQTMVQTGAAQNDIDGNPLAGGTVYRLLLNSDTGGAAAPQIAVSGVTYDASVPQVQVTPVLGAYTGNGAVEALFKLDVVNTSPAAGNTLEFSSVTVTFTNRTGSALSQDNVRQLFGRIAVVADNPVFGSQGSYQADIDTVTLVQISSPAFSVNGGGVQVVTVANPNSADCRIGPASTRTYFIAVKMTDTATSAAPSDSFKVQVAPGVDTVVRDGPSDIDQSAATGSPVATSSPTIVAPAPPPTPNYPAPIAPAGTQITGNVLLNVLATPGGTPADTVFAATDDGKLHALNNNGTSKWTFDAKSPIIKMFEPMFTGFESNPYVYLVTQAGDVIKLQDNGASAPTSVWSSTPTIGAAISANIMYSANCMYMGTTAGRLYRIGKDGATNAGDWNCNPGLNGAVTGIIVADTPSPWVAMNAVWTVSAGGGLYRLDKDYGTVNVPATPSTAIQTEPFLIDGYQDSSRNTHDIYFGDDNGYLRARNSTNLTTPPSNWHDVPAGAPVRGSPFYDGDRRIFFGADNGTFFCVDFSSGDVYWTFQTGGPVRTMPVTDWDNTKVFFGSDDGNIYGLYTANGALVPGFPVKTGGEVRGSPICDYELNRVYLGSNDGKVYSVDIGP